ncbi:MAG TPA: 30S ribosomal protein S27e [Methanomicrobiales archaeon]|nr:30S ribosomal protein S27e [Methanomicrobiales archaeon]
MVRLERENRTVFYRVKCPECENEQIVFERASSRVDCVVCGGILAEPTGGKATIKGEILAVVE